MNDERDINNQIGKIEKHEKDIVNSNDISNKAKDNENSKFDAIIGIRKHISIGLIILIYSGILFVFIISLFYLWSLFFSSMGNEYTLLFDNTRKILIEILSILPWILLFFFGDHSQMKSFLKNK